MLCPWWHLRKAALLAILGIAFYIGLIWGSRLGDDANNWSNPLLDWLRASARHQELESQVSAAVDWVETKDAIAAEVVAGRLTLREAAQRFRDLHAHAPKAVQEGVRRANPGNSQEEIFSRAVIRWIEKRILLDEPERAQALIRKLEAQLKPPRPVQAVAFPGVPLILGTPALP